MVRTDCERSALPANSLPGRADLYPGHRRNDDTAASDPSGVRTPSTSRTTMSMPVELMNASSTEVLDTEKDWQR